MLTEQHGGSYPEGRRVVGVICVCHGLDLLTDHPSQVFLRNVTPV